MANILYGVNGEGAGHSTRAKEVLAHLRKQGHTLHVASFDRGLANLRDQFEVTEIFGFRISYVNNRVRYKRTLARSLVMMPQAAKSVSRIRNLIETWKINLVITDFEPLTCHVGHAMGLPVISIDKPALPHQCHRHLSCAISSRCRRRETGDSADDSAR